MEYTKKVLEVLLLLATVAFAAVAFVKPVDDPDFFWHLENGELIAETGGLPAEDPFSYTTENADPRYLRLIMTGFWIPQLAYLAAHRLAGWHGIIGLRLLILTALFGSVVWRMWRSRVSTFVALVVLCLSVVCFGVAYPLDRPQILSFLFASLLLGMMETVRAGGRPTLFMPLLMVVWANSHGGYIVGDVLLALFAAGSLARLRSEPKQTLQRVAWATSGAVASMLNPNLFNAFPIALQYHGRDHLEFVTEYMSSFRAYSGGEIWPVALWALVGLTVIGIALSRKIYLVDLLILGFGAYFSMAYVRNTAFFAVAMAPLTAYYLDQGIRRVRSPEPLNWVVRLATTAVLVFGVYAFVVRMISTGDVYQRAVSDKYPWEASQFIETAQLDGRMFNHFDWGGFLIWRLGPDRQVFIDGRLLDSEVLSDYQTIGRAELGSGPDRQNALELIDDYQIDYVVQPLFQKNGLVPPLLKLLLPNPDWIPVYIDEGSYVLLRKTPRNLAAAERLELQPNTFIERSLTALDSAISSNPLDARLYLAKGELLLFYGLRTEAQKTLEMGLALEPSNFYIDYYLGQLRRGG